MRFAQHAPSLFARCASIYRKKGNVLLGYLLAKHALTFPVPAEDSCIEYPVYDHNMLIEFANCALLLGKFRKDMTPAANCLQTPIYQRNIDSSAS